MSGRPIKFSVRMHQAGYDYPSMRRIWTDADRLGYHSATLYDLLGVPALECWTTLSALAAETESIRLIPLVLANLYRSPGLLAKMAATLDVISGGRLELGIGAGGGEGDHLAFGYEYPSTSKRVKALEESVEVIKSLWTQPETTFHGDFYTLTGASVRPRPVQQPRPPILIGGRGEKRLLRAAARHADIANWGFDMDLREHSSKRNVLEEHCRAVGRNPADIEISHNCRVVIVETESELEKLADAAGMTAAGYRESLGNAIWGTPGQCADKLQVYVDAGITYFFLLFPDPIPTDLLELFASEVMPRFSTPPR